MKIINKITMGLLFCLLTACGTKVSRVEANSTIDLSGEWNDTDSRLVAQAMIEDCLRAQWLYKYKELKTNPRVIIGHLQNKSNKHIAVDTFVKDMERALLNSGKVDFVASKGERKQLRSEVQDMQKNASVVTMKQRGEEEAADLMLMGTINIISDRQGQEAVLFYQADLQLIELETNQKKWVGSKKIKKYVTG